MIDILPAPGHVAALRIEGTLTAADFDRVVAEIEGKLIRHARIGVFADVTALRGLTLEAFAKDLRYNLDRLGDWKRFPREAVVTDKAWMRRLVGWLDPVLPHVAVRAFEPAEREAALAWAADIGAE